MDWGPGHALAAVPVLPAVSAGAPPFRGSSLAAINTAGSECGPLARGAGGMRHPCSSQHRPGGTEASGSPVRAGLCVAPAAAVLPSWPPVYSSAARGDFLPLCPHTLPFPALHEEMSGKCLKSSLERFPLAIAVLLVPGKQ